MVLGRKPLVLGALLLIFATAEAEINGDGACRLLSLLPFTSR